MRPSLPRSTRRLSAMFMATALLGGEHPNCDGRRPDTSGRCVPAQPEQGPARPGRRESSTRISTRRPPKTARSRSSSSWRTTPVASYTGGVNGFSATNPARARQARRLDLKGTDAKRYRTFLKGKQDAFVKRLDANVKNAEGHPPLRRRPQRRGDAGTGRRPPHGQAPASGGLPGHAPEAPDRRSPAFIGAPTLERARRAGRAPARASSSACSTPASGPSTRRSPTPTRPASRTGAAAAALGHARVRVRGGANPGPAFACNNKLIGADRFMATYDAVGRPAAGRVHDAPATTTATARTPRAPRPATAASRRASSASRAAPSPASRRARTSITYKVCGDQGCFESDSVAAVQKAITDGVNVINFSISGGSEPLRRRRRARLPRRLQRRRVRGRLGRQLRPGAETVDHRGPWVTTVAASTDDARLRERRVTLTGATAHADAERHVAHRGISPRRSSIADASSPTERPAVRRRQRRRRVHRQDRRLPARRSIGRVQKGYNVSQRRRGRHDPVQPDAARHRPGDRQPLPADHPHRERRRARRCWPSWRSHPGATAT